MNTPLLIYLVAADVLALLLMLSDKRRAKRRERRIPEASLFLAALLGGALGGTMECSCFGIRQSTLPSGWAFRCLP